MLEDMTSYFDGQSQGKPHKGLLGLSDQNRLGSRLGGAFILVPGLTKAGQEEGCW